MSDYTSSDIKVMSDIDHIRLRYGMYIGEADNPYQLLSEVIDNSIDEAVLNPKTEIKVFIDNSKNLYRVEDTGRGIPIGLKDIKGKKLETLEVICTIAHSGGKFDSKNYATSSGLNGLGITCTSALSNYFKISTQRLGKKVTLETSKGIKCKDLVYEDVNKSYHGVTTEFIADDTIFDNVD